MMKQSEQHKLITNQSTYLNQVDVITVINGMIKALGMVSLRLQQFSTSDYAKSMAQALALFGERISENQVLEIGDAVEENEQQETTDGDKGKADSEDAMH